MGTNYNDRLYTTMCSERTLQSDTNGFFLQFSDNVINFAGPDWLNGTFAKIKTDRGRIEALFNDKQIKDLVCDTLSNVQCIYRKKDAQVSRDKRRDGEVFLKNGSTNKALVFFCQSVLRAPPKGKDLLTDAGRTLALALWGRSQALMELGELNAALGDLQLALKEGLPDKYKPELYLRMSLCYQKLDEENRAKVALALAEKLFGKNQQEFQAKKDGLKVGELVKKVNKKFLPEVSNGNSKDLENASSLVTVQESATEGRFLVAKENIFTGDTLVVESPQAACLLPECFGSHCHHCLKRLIAPVGCPECSGLAFCSTECRDKALQTYHKYECKILDLLIGSGMSILCHVALRMVTQEGFKRCLEMYKNKSKERIYSLCTHANQREPKDFLQRSLMSAFLLRCLQKCGFFGEKTNDANELKPSEEELQVAELILIHLQILQFNAHEIYETRTAETHRLQTTRTAYVGVGIYPTVALCNHDCYPAVTRYYVDRNIVIKATRPLKPGNVIAENYGPIFLKKKLADRQRNLMSRYWFKCQCLACREDWPGFDILQNKNARLKCPNNKCDGLFSQSVKEETTCPRCKEKISFKTVIETLKFCEEQYQTGIKTLHEEQPEKATPILIKAIDTFHSIASPPHKDTHLAQEALRTCLADTGNVYQCLVSNIQ